MNTHNLEKGIQLDDPELFIPWKIDEVELMRLANPLGLIDRSDEYNVYALPCSMFGIGKVEMIFRFDSTPGSLQRVEFQIPIVSDEDFSKTQSILELAFGQETLVSNEEKIQHLWTFGDTKISHDIWDSASGPIQMIIIENGEFEFDRPLVWYPFSK